jgi:hypothetical protein
MAVVRTGGSTSTTSWPPIHGDGVPPSTAGDPWPEVVVHPEPVERCRDGLEVTVLHRQRRAGGLEVGDDVVG